MRFLWEFEHPPGGRTCIIFKQIFVEILESFEKHNGKLKIKSEILLGIDLWTQRNFKSIQYKSFTTYIEFHHKYGENIKT